MKIAWHAETKKLRKISWNAAVSQVTNLREIKWEIQMKMCHPDIVKIWNVNKFVNLEQVRQVRPNGTEDLLMLIFRNK